MILSEHLVKCDTDGIDYNTHWYKWTIGRLQQVFLTVGINEHLNFFSFLLKKKWYLYFTIIFPAS